MNLYISLSQIGQKKKKMIKKIDFAIDFPVCVQKNNKEKTLGSELPRVFFAWSETNSQSELTLGELTGLSCFAETVLLTLDNSGIYSE